MGTRHATMCTQTLSRVPSWKGAEQRLLSQRARQRRNSIERIEEARGLKAVPFPGLAKVIEKDPTQTRKPRRSARGLKHRHLTPPQGGIPTREKKPGLPNCAKAASNNAARKAILEKKAADEAAKKQAELAAARQQAAAEKRQQELAAAHELRQAAVARAAEQKKKLREDRRRIELAGKAEREAASQAAKQASSELNQFRPPLGKEDSAYRVVQLEYGPYMN